MINNKENHDSVFNRGNVPMGLGMALAEYLNAMQYFSSLTDEQRQRVIDMTHGISSKMEMRSFVDSLAHKKIEFPGNSSFPEQNPAIF